MYHTTLVSIKVAQEDWLKPDAAGGLNKEDTHM